MVVRWGTKGLQDILGLKNVVVSVNVESAEERPWRYESHMCDEATVVK